MLGNFANNVFTQLGLGGGIEGTHDKNVRETQKAS
jgi:tetrahydromethanopterin S-methyltransferase subunit D